jgi:hypothetical protein
MHKIQIANLESGETELLVTIEDEQLSEVTRTLFQVLAGAEVAGKSDDFDWTPVIVNLIHDNMRPLHEELELVAKNLQTLHEELLGLNRREALTSAISDSDFEVLREKIEGLEKWANVHAKDERERTETASAEVSAPTNGKPHPNAGRGYVRQRKARKGVWDDKPRTKEGGIVLGFYKKSGLPILEWPRELWGKYCRNCAKELSGTQKIFCSRSCAKRWNDAHKDRYPTPRYTLEPDAFTTRIVPGVGVESAVYAADAADKEEA